MNANEQEASLQPHAKGPWHPAGAGRADLLDQIDHVSFVKWVGVKGKPTGPPKEDTPQKTACSHPSTLNQSVAQDDKEATCPTCIQAQVASDAQGT